MRAFGNDDYYCRLIDGFWAGQAFLRAKFPRRMAPASTLQIAPDEWRHAWPDLLQRIESGDFELLEHNDRGDSLAGEIELAGRPVRILIRRPRWRTWHERLRDQIIGNLARRAWKRAWQLQVEYIGTAWPLLLMEKRVMGRLTDAIMVFERVDGHPPDWPGWSHDIGRYHRVLTRCGRMLRRMEQTGLFLPDAKASDWVVRNDEKLGLVPILVGIEGIRPARPREGVLRLMLSFCQTRGTEFTEADALALVQGYAPWADPAETERWMEMYRRFQQFSATA